ncbi:MAG: hydrogenase maturation protease [Acidobacteriota bacterium]|jgi:hydrogenase maturation protease
MTGQQKPPLLVIGVGNRFRGDDAAGLLVVSLLRDMGLDSSLIIEHSGEGAALMETWKGADAVIMIDAVSSGGAPGTIHRLDPIRNPLPAQMFHGSTHAFSLPDAIEMARALDELPPRLLVFGIEGRNFQAGDEVSPELNKALPEVAKLVLKTMEALRAGTGNGD